MPRIAYIKKKFTPANLKIVAQANDIIAEYATQGFELTLRQLYYQFVSRDLIANKQQEYKRLGSVINDARLAGMIDWEAIIDRTRNLASLSRWSSPSEIVNAVAKQYHIDLWEGQKVRPEVWIEKDALVGIIESVCQEYDVPFFSCRGYTSQSEMWVASQRYRRIVQGGQTPVILHFGDHDPSGKDMTRDIDDRLQLFMGGLDVKRLALNIDQIKKYNPPPNPCKITDSRAGGYIREFGHESWELDALDPKVVATLIRDNIKKLIDPKKWKIRIDQREEEREKLQEIADELDA